MLRRSQSALPLLLCVMALPLCALFLRPQAEIGVIDDWSYIRTAQVLAATGHVVYNGWATAMLGWQLYAGALLIKIFGFSFTAPRVATLLVAMGTAALMQRVLVRLGITEWNSAAATLIFLLSPVFMAMTFSFMSDVYGVFVMIGCFYCCIRALQASSQATSAAWIAAAALGNAVGGSARQIAWFGLLVMVPCTLWLLRKRRFPFLVGAGSTIVGLLVMVAILHWFQEQPYSLREPVIPPVIPRARLFVFHYFIPFWKRSLCELLFLSMPLLLVCTPNILRTRRSRMAALVFLLLALVVALNAHRTHTSGSWMFPFLFNSVWDTGFDFFHAYLGYQPLLLTYPVRLAITTLIYVGALALLCTLVLGQRTASVAEESTVDPGRVLKGSDLYMLLVPCTLAYLLLLLTRLITTSVVDRYMLFPEFAFLVLVTVVYQRNTSRHLPGAIWVLIALGATLDTMGLHDTFALYRAQAALAQQLINTGVPRTAIDAGAQFDGWTQITATGHTNDIRITRPAHLYLPLAKVPTTDPCRTEDLQLSPVVQARYVLSFDPKACRGPAAVAPVTFTTWYGPHTRTLYAVMGPYR